MKPVPNHPYALYKTGHDQVGQFWIECYCRHCGAPYKKVCSRPMLANQIVLRFAQLHAHGLRPTVVR